MINSILGIDNSTTSLQQTAKTASFIAQVVDPSFNGYIVHNNQTIPYTNLQFVRKMKKVYKLVSTNSIIIHKINSLDEFGLFVCFCKEFLYKHPEIIPSIRKFRVLTDEWHHFKNFTSR
jgi:hypothetical protein